MKALARLLLFACALGAARPAGAQTPPADGVGTLLRRMEQVLRASGLDWQAVRPVRLSGGAGTGRAAITDSFPASATIPRADVAAFMLAELERPHFTARTPMIAAA